MLVLTILLVSLLLLLLLYYYYCCCCSCCFQRLSVKVKIITEHFWSALNNRAIIEEAPTPTAIETCVVVCASVCKIHTSPSYSRASTLQSSVAVTHYVLAVAYFTCPRQMESWVEIVGSGDWNQTTCTLERLLCVQVQHSNVLSNI